MSLVPSLEQTSWVIIGQNATSNRETNPILEPRNAVHYLPSHCPYHVITDIDECESAVSNNCDVHALCTNTEGSYICRCQRGYEGDGILCKGTIQCVIIV